MDQKLNKYVRDLLLFALLISCCATAHAKKITLNLKQADINAVITTVAEATGKNFIVDPRVKGKITIISSRPLDESQVYQVFLTILDVHGFTAVPSGKVIKILPDADAKHAGMPLEGEGEEVITRIIEVKHVQASQLVPILRPLVPPQGHLAAHSGTNILIIADRASNIDRIMGIIDRIDEPSSSEIEVVNLQHASASEVVRVLTALDKGNKEKKTESTTLVADERTNTILMGGDKSDRLRLKTIIAHLDTPSETVGNTHVIYLRYAQAKELVTVLTGVGNVQAKGGNRPKAAARQNTDFNIQADEASNALVITAAPDIFRSLENVIQKLDVRRAQVLVEAIIAEVSASKSSELGVNWAAGAGSLDDIGRNPVGISNLGNNSISGIAGAIAAAESGNFPSLPAGATFALGKITSGYSFAGIITALAGDGNANVLSTPNIVTMDNEEAEIFVGKEVSVPSGSFSSTGNNTGISNPFTTFKAKQVGIRLKVKPQINEGDAIKLEIDQAVDAITAGNAGEASLVTSQRTIKTSVMVNDGEVVVLGGLITDDQQETTQKIPLLGDIPILGMLFRYKREVEDKTNLMVFLRPVILRDAAVTASVSGSKYNFMRAKQLDQRSFWDFFTGDERPLLPELEELLKEYKKDGASKPAESETSSSQERLGDDKAGQAFAGSDDFFGLDF